VTNQLRYQEVEFVLDYNKFNHPEFTSIPLFHDRMVLVARRNHPRIASPLSEEDIYREQHATVALDRYASFSYPWYSSEEQQACVAFHGNAMVSVLSVVSQTNMVAIAPEWLAKEFEEQFALQLLPLPLEMDSRTCYLSWHETAGQEKPSLDGGAANKNLPALNRPEEMPGKTPGILLFTLNSRPEN
jgi:LysR family transcriptional activator for leuABCD operon